MVVGGGIGGLATAVGLLRAGWRVTILERAAEAGRVGAGLTMMANALRALGVHRVDPRRILREALPADILHGGAEVLAVHGDDRGAEVDVRTPV
ncbi:hypothetical protein CA850_04235 [Micromonospora echinospora]|nr:hypothetical protein CA850_04235 [Micromonospora echinospora]